MPIQIVKIINDGNKQLLAQPKEFSIDTTEVNINKQGDHLIISPKNTIWDAFFNSTSAFDEDVLSHREDSPPQEREPCGSGYAVANPTPTPTHKTGKHHASQYARSPSPFSSLCRKNLGR